ncbi:hypothetical protein Tco_0830629 [Tanacetum coccineum]
MREESTGTARPRSRETRRRAQRVSRAYGGRETRERALRREGQRGVVRRERAAEAREERQRNNVKPVEASATEPQTCERERASESRDSRERRAVERERNTRGEGRREHASEGRRAREARMPRREVLRGRAAPRAERERALESEKRAPVWREAGRAREGAGSAAPSAGT